MVEDLEIFDAATVGGGIVGLSAALTLAAAGYRVAVVERQPATRVTGDLGYDLRTVALSPASVSFLDELVGSRREPTDGESSGRAPRVADLAPIETMRVWEHDGAGELRFTAPNRAAARLREERASVAGEDPLAHETSSPNPLAWVAENSALVTRLWQAAENRVTFLVPASLTALATGDDFVTLVYRREDDGAERQLRTRLAIAADGTESRLRELAGTRMRIEASPKSGPQCALATVARTRDPHRNTAWQRFGATGPVALLPLAGERNVAVIWSVAESVGARLRDLDDAQFQAALGNETEHVCGGFDAVDRRFFFPLRQALATDFNPMPRVILAGDAARTLHPLAGQGVNIGLEDVRAIASALGTGGDKGDLGAANRWRGYADSRRRRSKLMLALMRGLLAAYCGPLADNPWMRLARNATVRCIDSSPSAKAQLVREAFGLGPLASW